MNARELHGLAATQKWLLKRDQVLQYLSVPQLKYALETGELVAVLPTVYKPWGAPEWWEQRLLAATWAFDATAAMRSAARLTGLNGVPSVRLELLVPYPRAVRAAGVLVHSSNFLPPEHITEIDGIRVTTPDRTCLDLSAVCSTLPLTKAWESAKAADLVSAESLQRTAIKMQARGRRRMATVWKLLESWDPSLDLKDVELQTRTWRWIEADGVPLPEIEFWVVVNGVRYRLDFAWPPLKVCVECNGWATHGATRRGFDRDNNKTTELELAGWLVVQVTSTMSRRTVIDRINRALAMRSGSTFLQ